MCNNLIFGTTVENNPTNGWVGWDFQAEPDVNFKLLSVMHVQIGTFK